MKALFAIVCFLVISGCARETATTSTGRMTLQGRVGDVPVLLEAQAESNSHTKETSNPPAALGEGLGWGGKLLQFAHQTGLLGPWGPVAGVAGMALTAAAGYMATKKKGNQLKQAVSGLEDYKRTLDPEGVDALHSHLGRHMDRSTKNAVRKHRGH